MEKRGTAGLQKDRGEPIRSVTLELFADGAVAAHCPDADKIIGLSGGSLNGALEFARQHLSLPTEPTLGDPAKRQVRVYRFFDCEARVLPNSVAQFFKTDRDGEEHLGAGPSLAILVSPQEARQVAAVLNSSAEAAAAGKGPPRREEAH
jgi:hypothetical protein